MGDRELFIIILISIIVVVFLAIAIIILYNVFQSRILKELNEAHEKEIIHKNNLIANSIEVQERERKRIAKDLHDEIGSKLSIVNLNINLLKDTVQTNEKIEKIIDHIELSLTDSIKETRSISHNLYPPILDKFGIQSAIESLSKEITRTGKLRVSTDISHEWKAFTKDEELHLYRIFQELLHNTIKHADASEVQINSKTIDNYLTIVYEDNGKGIDAENAKNGLGMSSIETRLNILNGKSKIDEDRKKGYKIQFEFSVD